MIDSVTATANADHSVTVSGKAYNADRVTVTIDGVEKSATLEEDGSYTFTSKELEVGAYEVTVKAFDGDKSVSEMTQVAVVDEQTSIAGFVLDKQIVKGEEVSYPVAGATVTVDGMEYTTNAAGFYQIPELATDRYYDIKITKPEHETTMERVRVQKDRVSSVITEDFNAISKANIKVEGSLVDKVTGAEIDGKVHFQAYSEDLGEWITIHTEDTVDGAFSITQDSEGITPTDFIEFGGEYRLVLDSANYHDEVVDFTVNDEKQITNLSAVELAPVAQTTITGKVTRDGSAVEGAEVNLAGLNTVTDANGVYKFDKKKIPSGDYDLVVNYDGTAAGENNAVTTKAISIEEGKNLSGQDVTLALGADVDFTVAAPAAKEFKAQDLTAVVYNADGVAVSWETKEAAAVAGTSKVEFKGLSNHLPTGKYTVEVHGDYIVPQEYNIEVTAADVAGFVDEGKTKSFSGENYVAAFGGVVTALENTIHITNPDQLDADDKWTVENTVVVLKDSKGEIAYSTSAAPGFGFTSVAPGKYSVELYKPGYEFDKANSNKTSITVNANGDVAYAAGDLDLVVPTLSASVQGLVRDADTLKEISGATVSFYQEGSLVSAITSDDYADGAADDLLPGIYTVVVRDNSLTSNDGGTLEYKTYVEQLTLNNKDDIKNHHFNLDKEAAQIDLSVVDGANKALAADTITVFDAWADRSKAASEEAGTYTVTGTPTEVFKNLSVGEFDVVVSEAGYDTQTVGVSLEDNEDFRSTVVLNESAATYEVNVNVVQKDTTTPVDSKLVVFNESGDIVRTVGSSFDLPNGTYTVASYVDGFYVSSKEFKIDRKDVTLLLEVEKGDWEAKK
ncbi:hypothetical protein M1J35_00460 [Rossellomorea sp. KS-H15a]|nr:hypothetical protein M1J35_00460 [Rossellomorea sp. KS-H15a]